MQSKFIKSKKAISLSFNTIRWIDKSIFLIVNVLIIIFMIQFATQLDTNTTTTEADTFTLNLVYSPYGISYQNPHTNVFKPGTISLEELNSGIIENRINSSFSYGEDNNYITAKITIIDTIGNEIKTIYYNSQEKFDNWAIYSSLDNSQNFKYFVKTLPIFIDEGTTTNNVYEENIKQGNVIFEIILNTN